MNTFYTSMRRRVGGLLAGAVALAGAAGGAELGAGGYKEFQGLAKIYVVATNGDDANLGTADKPFRTISRAAAVVQAGEGVLVRAGVYRERVAPARGGTADKPIVYLAEPGHRVFLKGSDVWKPQWSPVAPHIFSAKPDDALFTDDVYFDSANPLKVFCTATPWERNGRVEYEYFSGGKKPDAAFARTCDRKLVYTLGQLFVDGRMFKQLPFRKELEAEAGSWFFDAASGQVLVHLADEQAPERHAIELTTRRRIFAPHVRGLGYIHVIGFVMEHCGNQYPRDFWSVRENAQAGALGTRAGHHWLIRDNVLRFANGLALDLGAEGPDSERANPPATGVRATGHHVVENNWFTDNGAGGIAGYMPSDVRITGNVFLRNNNLRFKGKKRYESAALKLHTPNQSLVADNLFMDNYTCGIWFDGGFGKGARVTRNIILGNRESEHGMFVEMGVYPADTGWFDHNIVLGHKDAFYCHDGSGVTTAHNLLANSSDYGIQVRQVGPRCNTKNHAFFNNLVFGNATNVVINYPAELGGNIRLDYNIYTADADARKFFVSKYSKFDPSWTEAQFQGMMQSDLAASAEERAAFAHGSYAWLTLSEWQKFWGQHSAASDAHSVLDASASVALDPAKLELTLTISDAALHVGSINQSVADKDFSGVTIPQKGQALPGPWQQLKPGKNILHLWHGINPAAADAVK